MDETTDGIAAAIRGLRDAQEKTLAQMPQSEVVETLAALAALWRDPAYALRREAETWMEPFPFKMVQVSLDALLDSLQPAALWVLIDSEEARDAQGYPVIGHVIAGNTPLLSWVSIIRALLVRSASLVKLPSGPASNWGRVFHRSLAEAAPELAACVHLLHWSGGTTDLDAALCGNTDLVMAHGSDETMCALRALCPPTKPFVGYGHRVSFGLVTKGSWTMGDAAGFAKDVLLYDQGGCLSPQTIFVEGNWEQTLAFAEQLAGVLHVTRARYSLPVRAERAAMVVREARDLAHMEAGNRLWGDPGLRWTVIARPQTSFTLSPTFGIISVQPLETMEDLPEAVAPVAGHLQGCAVAGETINYLPGVSYLCAPGELQAPPLSWRQDGRDVLRVLLPPRPSLR
ncbi:MAG: hypothetical protein M3Y13_11535 [Armatimonadota bacterium]|nr:hypothetical protein [Armatimonadota bacterium]